MKQTEGFGPSGETIMDYSIYDAISAGFGKVVFIIRKDFADNFKSNFGAKLNGKIDVEYVYQEMNSFVDEADIPAERTKPWGTGHAILCAADVVQEPFAVINADDYYGKDAFVKAAEFLTNECDEHTYAIIGYQLDKTLSEHGTVSRGVCETDENNNLVSINERTKIYKDESGKVIYEDGGNSIEVPATSSVSMNFWCFHPSVFIEARQLFRNFVRKNKEDIKAEFFIPIIADDFIRKEGNTVRVIPTIAQWFGVTYKEDAPSVKQSIDELVNNKTYPVSLWQSEPAVS